jgi:hypothetical protein
VFRCAVVLDEPDVEIGLQFVDRQIDLLAKRNPVELVQDSTMEAFANAVGLRALGLGAAVIDSRLTQSRWKVGLESSAESQR